MSSKESNFTGKTQRRWKDNIVLLTLYYSNNWAIELGNYEIYISNILEFDIFPLSLEGYL